VRHWLNHIVHADTLLPQPPTCTAYEALQAEALNKSLPLSDLNTLTIKRSQLSFWFTLFAPFMLRCAHGALGTPFSLQTKFALFAVFDGHLRAQIFTACD
jgi:hypothetical protein